MTSAQESPPPANANPDAESDRPAIVFSLWHLFLVTTAIAIVLGMIFGTGLDLSAPRLFHLLWGCQLSLGASGIVIGLIERGRGRVFPAEPGHIWLGLISFMTIADLVDGTLPHAWLIVRGAECCIWLGISWIGVATYSPTFAWRILFVTSALIAAGLALSVLNDSLRESPFALQSVFRSTRALLLVILAVVFGIVAVLDACWFARRDWLHWLGIGSLVSLATLNALLQLVISSFKY